jgi:hypothetical protein
MSSVDDIVTSAPKSRPATFEHQQTHLKGGFAALSFSSIAKNSQSPSALRLPHAEAARKSVGVIASPAAGRQLF